MRVFLLAGLLSLSALSYGSEELLRDCDAENDLCKVNCQLKYSDSRAGRTGCNLRCTGTWSMCSSAPVADSAKEKASQGWDATKGFFQGVFSDDEDEEE